MDRSTTTSAGNKVGSAAMAARASGATLRRSNTPHAVSTLSSVAAAATTTAASAAINPTAGAASLALFSGATARLEMHDSTLLRTSPSASFCSTVTRDGSKPASEEHSSTWCSADTADSDHNVAVASCFCTAVLKGESRIPFNSGSTPNGGEDVAILSPSDRVPGNVTL